MVKVTLIRPRYFSVWESLACGYIGSYLKQYYRGELKLQFFDGFFDSDREIVDGAVDSDVVGFSCTSPQMEHALALAAEIKAQNPKVKTVFGGHHPSVFPKETKGYPQVDMVIVGEGEIGMLLALQAGRNSIYYPRLILDLDTIPFPDRKLIRQDRTIAITEKNDKERIASILSGRGCPFHCIFCTGDHDVFGNIIRKRSVGNVLGEIALLIKEWKIDFLKFADAEINSKLNWVKDFCREKAHRKIKIPFGCNVHAAIMDKSTLELMKKANCREIWVGVESGSPRILKEIGKGVTVEMIANVFRWAKEVGIKRRAYLMVGFPSETREDFDMTMQLAERIDADVYGITVPCPYPGTAIYSKAYRNIDWSEQDEYENNLWRTKNFSNEELKSMQREFVKKFRDRLCFRQKQWKV